MKRHAGEPESAKNCERLGSLSPSVAVEAVNDDDPSLAVRLWWLWGRENELRELPYRALEVPCGE